MYGASNINDGIFHGTVCSMTSATLRFWGVAIQLIVHLLKTDAQHKKYSASS